MSKISIYESEVIKPLFKDYDDDSPDLQFHNNRHTYWTMLRDEHALDPENYLAAVEKKYGIKPQKFHDGSFTDKYDIVDDKAYLAYLVKYGVK